MKKGRAVACSRSLLPKTKYFMLIVFHFQTENVFSIRQESHGIPDGSDGIPHLTYAIGEKTTYKDEVSTSQKPGAAHTNTATWWDYPDGEEEPNYPDERKYRKYVDGVSYDNFAIQDLFSLTQRVESTAMPLVFTYHTSQSYLEGQNPLQASTSESQNRIQSVIKNEQPVSWISHQPPGTFKTESTGIEINDALRIQIRADASASYRSPNEPEARMNILQHQPDSDSLVPQAMRKLTDAEAERSDIGMSTPPTKFTPASTKPLPHPSDQPSSTPNVSPSQLPTTRPSTTTSSLPREESPNGRTGSVTTTRIPRPDLQFRLTDNPSQPPIAAKTKRPTLDPSFGPTNTPSQEPSLGPTNSPSQQPSIRPTNNPSNKPSSFPHGAPSLLPSSSPSIAPTITLSATPSTNPSGNPTRSPTQSPSNRPTRSPSLYPTLSPSRHPSNRPSRAPSKRPSNLPSTAPSKTPSNIPSSAPSKMPSSFPSIVPSPSPSAQPSKSPSMSPSMSPSKSPSTVPSSFPSSSPSERPTRDPSSFPSYAPSFTPSAEPSSSPSSMPSLECHDNASYRNPRNPHLACEHHRLNGTRCMDWLGLMSASQVDELISNCPFSCDICETAPPSGSPSFHPSARSSSFPLQFLALTVPDIMDLETQTSFEAVSKQYFVDALSRNSSTQTAQVTGVRVDEQERLQASRRLIRLVAVGSEKKNRKQLRSSHERSLSGEITLKIGTTVRAIPGDSAVEVLEEALAASVDDPRYTEAIRQIEFFREATVMTQSMHDKLLNSSETGTAPKKGDTSAVAAVTVILLSAFGAVATVGLSAGGFFCLKKRRRTGIVNNSLFTPSPEISRDVQLISEELPSSKDETKSEAGMEEDEYQLEEGEFCEEAPFCPTTSTCKEGFNFNQVDDLGSFDKHSVGESRESMFHHQINVVEKSSAWRPHNLLEGIPPMIVIGNIEQNMRENNSLGQFPVLETLPESGDTATKDDDVNQDDFKDLLVRHIEASSSFVEAISSQRPDSSVPLLVDMLCTMKSQESEEDFFKLVSPVSRPKLESGEFQRSEANTIGGGDGDDSVASTPAKPQSAEDYIDMEKTHRRISSAGAVQKIQPSEALDHLIRTEWSTDVVNLHGDVGHLHGPDETPLVKNARKTIQTSTTPNNASTSSAVENDIVVELSRLEKEFQKSRDVTENESSRVRSFSEPEKRKTTTRERTFSDPEKLRLSGAEDERHGSDGQSVSSNFSTSASRSGSRSRSRRGSQTASSATSGEFSPFFPTTGSLPPHHSRSSSRGSQAGSRTVSPSTGGEPSPFFQNGSSLVPHHDRNNSRGSQAGSRVSSPTFSSVDLNGFVSNGAIIQSNHSRNNSRGSVGTKRSWCDEMHSHVGGFRYTFNAPSRGKLGIIIESSKDLGPIIHTVKDYSPLFGMVEPGDKIVSVGKRNTEHMSTSEVTHFLAQKRAEKEDGVIQITVVSASEKTGIPCDDMLGTTAFTHTNDGNNTSAEPENDGSDAVREGDSAHQLQGDTIPERQESLDCSNSVSAESEEGNFHLIGDLGDDNFDDYELF